MNFIETVRHFTFLLSKKNLQFVNEHEAEEPKNLAREIEGFSETIQQVIATYYAPEREEKIPVVSNDPQHSPDVENPSHVPHSSARTADVATAMFTESKKEQNNSVSRIRPINKKDRDHVIDKAKRCLKWAHDPARPVVPGAEAMTNDQVR